MARDEGREACAVLGQHRLGGQRPANEGARQAAEELGADQRPGPSGRSRPGPIPGSRRHDGDGRRAAPPPGSRRPGPRPTEVGAVGAGQMGGERRLQVTQRERHCGPPAAIRRSRARRFVEQHRQRRQVGVPFDQGRAPAEALHDVGEQRPHAIAHPRTVIVDQDGLAVGVVHGMAGEMVLGDRLARQVQPAARIEAQIVRRHGDVVHVEQQAAAAPPDELAQELGFAQRRLRETQVAGRVLDRYLPAQRLLQALHVAHDDGERLFGVGQRQEVVEVAAAVAAPGKMVRHQRRLEPLHQGGDARQMRLVEPVHRAQRQADGMNGERVVGSQGFDGLGDPSR